MPLEFPASPVDGEVYEGFVWDEGTQLWKAKFMPTNAPAILQVVQTVKLDTFSTTSTSMVDVTGLSAAINLTNSANKVLIICDIKLGAQTSTIFQLTGGNSSTYIGNAASNRARGAGASLLTIGGNDIADNSQTNTTAVYLDTPAVSSVTYKAQIRSGAGQTAYVNRSNNDGDDANRNRLASSITLMEVAG